MSQPRWERIADLPRRPRLLVVADEASLIQTVHLALGAECQVFVAADRQSAVALCAEKLPDMLLVDHDLLGDSTGPVLAHIRGSQSLQHIPVLFFVSDPGRGGELMEAEVHSADFAVKPVNPNVLQSRVRTHLLLKLHSEQLRGMTFRDGLTGLYSRAYFEEQIALECARAKRTGEVLSLMLVDMNQLQAYNQAHGHAAGDDALRVVARILDSQLHRPGDLIARYGGDELVCLLPATDFEPAMQLAERLERAVRERSIAHAGSGAAAAITVSIGLVTRRRAPDGGPDAMLEGAHEQLAQAKQQGGVRVSGKVLHRPFVP